MEAQYAEALWQMIKGGMDHKKAVNALHEKLKSQGRVEMWARIGRAFGRIAERELKRGRLTLSVAREKDAHKAEAHVKKVLQDLNISATEMDTKVDESLIGGWRLEGAEHLIDASFKKNLLSIYNRATQ